MAKRNRKKDINNLTDRNPVAVAMMRRYGQTNTVHADRRTRRAKDAKNHWAKDEE